MGLSDLLQSTWKGVTGNMANQAKNDLSQKARTSGQKLGKEMGDKLGKAASKAMRKKEDVVFCKMPRSLNELLEQEGSDLTSPFKTAAFMIVALYNYVEDKEVGKSMMEFLNGPEDLSNMDLQNLDMALSVKTYVPRSYFKGAVPENDYTPTEPWTVHVEEDGLSYQEDGYCTLYVTSGGADNPRPITMRRKGDKWYIWQSQRQLTSDIRIPKSQDKWA